MFPTRRSNSNCSREKTLMSRIIKGSIVVEDDWNVLRLAETDSAESVAVPSGKVIVPLQVWLGQADLKNRNDLGVWFAGDESAEELRAALTQNPQQFALIAVDFAKFTDGRGYSI